MRSSSIHCGARAFVFTDFSFHKGQWNAQLNFKISRCTKRSSGHYPWGGGSAYRFLFAFRGGRYLDNCTKLELSLSADELDLALTVCHFHSTGQRLRIILARYAFLNFGEASKRCELAIGSECMSIQLLNVIHKCLKRNLKIG